MVIHKRIIIWLFCAAVVLEAQTIPVDPRLVSAHSFMQAVESGLAYHYQQTGKWGASLEEIMPIFNPMTIEGVIEGKVADRLTLLKPPYPTNAAGEQMLALTTNQLDDTPSWNLGRWVVWHFEPPASPTLESATTIRRYNDFENRPLVRTEWVDEKEVEQMFAAVGKKPPNGGIWKLPGQRPQPLDPKLIAREPAADPKDWPRPLTKHQAEDIGEWPQPENPPQPPVIKSMTPESQPKRQVGAASRNSGNNADTNSSFPLWLFVGALALAVIWLVRRLLVASVR